jgi:hypothetical protein
MNCPEQPLCYPLEGLLVDNAGKMDKINMIENLPSGRFYM